MKRPSFGRLTQKEEKLLQLFIFEGKKDVECLIEAGYKSKDLNTQRKDVSRILRRPQVQARMDEMIKERDRMFLFDKKFVIDKLKDTALKYPGTPSGTKALELLGKYLGMFSDTIRISDEDHVKDAEAAWEKRKEKIIKENPEEAKICGLVKDGEPVNENNILELVPKEAVNE